MARRYSWANRPQDFKTQSRLKAHGGPSEALWSSWGSWLFHSEKFTVQKTLNKVGWNSRNGWRIKNAWTKKFLQSQQPLRHEKRWWVIFLYLLCPPRTNWSHWKTSFRFTLGVVPLRWSFNPWGLRTRLSGSNYWTKLKLWILKKFKSLKYSKWKKSFQIVKSYRFGVT